MIFFFFVCISMSWCALHLHYGRAIVSRERTNAALPDVFNVFRQRWKYQGKKIPTTFGEVWETRYHILNLKSVYSSV